MIEVSPADYQSFVKVIQEKTHQVQHKAMRAEYRQLLSLYNEKFAPLVREIRRSHIIIVSIGNRKFILKVSFSIRNFVYLYNTELIL